MVEREVKVDIVKIKEIGEVVFCHWIERIVRGIGGGPLSTIVVVHGAGGVEEVVRSGRGSLNEK